jgi:glycosyltransferase involved in cell wall biosynthesis
MQPWRIYGGIGNVAYYLTEALMKRINLTRFPELGFRYPIEVIKVHQKFLARGFSIVHFNLAPSMIHYYFTPRWGDGSYFLLKYAKNLGVKTILNIHGITILENEKHQLERFVASRTRVIANASKQVDQIIINAEHMRSKVISAYGVDNEKIVIIPNGVNLDMFSKQNRKIFLSGDPAILFVGHVCWGKGIDVLLEAMVNIRNSLPNAKLHVVGTGLNGRAELENIKHIVKQKHLENQVIFHGAVPHSRIPYYYKSAALCVLPSRHEGFPITMLEAMASGVPFISSDIASFQEILKNGENALFFKSEDAVSLSTAILRLCTDSTLREKIIQGASKTVADFGWDRIADRYISVYQDLCE